MVHCFRKKVQALCLCLLLFVMFLLAPINKIANAAEIYPPTVLK